MVKSNCLGDGFNSGGKHTAKTGGKQTQPYTTWMNMRRRCNDSKLHDINPTYKDCTICDEWLDYQVFAEWLTNNRFYDLDYELDKDLLVSGNKVYGPDVCCLVPHEINSLLLNCGANNRELPIGVSKRRKGFIARMAKRGIQSSLGTYRTKQEAHQAYVISKEAHVKDMANEWRELIDDRVYWALMSWRVNQ